MEIKKGVVEMRKRIFCFAFSLLVILIMVFSITDLFGSSIGVTKKDQQDFNKLILILPKTITVLEEQFNLYGYDVTDQQILSDNSKYVVFTDLEISDKENELDFYNSVIVSLDLYAKNHLFEYRIEGSSQSVEEVINNILIKLNNYCEMYKIITSENLETDEIINSIKNESDAIILGVRNNGSYCLKISSDCTVYFEDMWRSEEYKKWDKFGDKRYGAVLQINSKYNLFNINQYNGVACRENKKP